ncbi:MAG: PA2169 family four-helix-bundle protein [Rhodanobacter sp.]
MLNKLVEATIDSVQGYTEAAGDARKPFFHDHFLRRADERKEVCSMLQTQVRLLGGEPYDEGTFLAPSHRMFALLCKAMSSDDKAVVDEIERGEEHIKGKFEDALQDDEISVASREVIQRGYASVLSGHHEMRALKHVVHKKD